METTEAIESIEVLTFQINQTRFAVDLNEIFELIELKEANQRECEIIRFEQEFMFDNIPVKYHSPKVLLPKSYAASGILIDQVSEICMVSIDCIKPLPGLVKKFSQSRIWGTALVKNEIVFLVEFQ